MTATKATLQIATRAAALVTRPSVNSHVRANARAPIVAEYDHGNRAESRESTNSLLGSAACSLTNGLRRASEMGVYRAENTQLARRASEPVLDRRGRG